MITVYVLQSIKDGTYYTGMAINAALRLREHNAGKNRFTKGHLPWKIIYTEEHSDWGAPRPGEKYLKTAGGKKWLITKLHGGDTGSPPA